MADWAANDWTQEEPQQRPTPLQIAAEAVAAIAWIT